MRRLGTVEISLGLLKQLLQLPSDVKLLRVHQSWEDETHNTFTVLVEALNLLEVPEGSAIPRAVIELSGSFCKVDEVSHLVSGRVKNFNEN